MKEMNQEAFTYDKHEMGWWTAFDLTFAESLDAAAIKRLVKKYAIGYCDSSRIKVRPRSDSFAVMFFTENLGEFWFHVPKWAFSGNCKKHRPALKR